MKFTTFGHLLAFQQANLIYVLRFFTVELPENYVFNWHSSNVKQINWFDDDTGFASCDGHSTIALWLLPKAGQPGPNVPLWTYN
jgi:hypothetical protein